MVRGPDGRQTSGQTRLKLEKEEKVTKMIRGKSLLVSLVLAVILAVGSLVLVEAKPAKAAFPGQNGEIAFASIRDGRAEIYVMNSDGSNPTRLTKNPARDAAPDWGAAPSGGGRL